MSKENRKWEKLAGETEQSRLFFLSRRIFAGVVQSLSCVWLLATPWAAACPDSLSFTISQVLLKLMSTESVMPSNHLNLCHLLLLLPLIFPSIRVFSSQHFPSGGQSIGASASASVLPMNIQDWFHFGWTGWIPCNPRDSQERVFSNTTVKSINSSGPSFLYSPTLTSIQDYWKNHVD